MARNSPTITFRIPELHLAQLKAEIERLNRNPLSEQWTTTEFILMAILEKIALNTRRRKYRRKKKPTVLSGAEAAKLI